MKKLLFALPILALSLVFTFCDRPSLQDELSVATPAASDRATLCNVQFDRASPTAVTICGTNLNAQNCSSCTGDKAQGVTVLPAGVTPVNLNLMAPIELSLTSATGNTVTITTSAGAVIVTIPGGGCKKVRIDDSCGVTAI